MPMPMYLSDNNPNDTCGGGGCVCFPRRQAETKGPFVVIPSNDMLDHLSPHVVVCAPCVKFMVTVTERETLAMGERTHIPIVDVVDEGEDDPEI